jgi:hypothetical protein
MSRTANRKFYSGLSDQEKLALMSEIWRSMEDAGTDVDQAFVEEVRQSQRQYRENPRIAVTWEEMAKRLGWDV